MASQITSSHRIGLSIGSWLALLLFAGSGAIAEPIEVDPREDGAPEQLDARGELYIESQTAIPTRRLTLDAALALSVKKNLGVEVSRYEPAIAEQEMKGAWGAYDPTLSANTGYQLNESPRTTFASGGDSKDQQRIISAGSSLTGLLPYIGATLGIELETSRNKGNFSFESLSPKYESSIFLTAKIPLLRGLIWNEPWTQVKVSKIGYFASVDGFTEAVMDITESTINIYWKLVADREQMGVAVKSLETAQALLGQTQTQFEVGVVSKVEVVEAEAGVADREFKLIVAQNTFENSGDALIDAVLGRELKATTNFRLEPADDPENYEIRDVNVERAVATAFAKLPELSRADRAIEERELQLRFAKNSRLPQFDIDARYGYVNKSGDANSRNPTPPPASLTGSYRKSYNDMFSEDGFENYSVVGTFSIPIPNRTARRNVTRGEIDLRRARSLKSRTEQDVILDVRSAARGILASARGIEAAERRRLAAEEQLRAERIRLEHGESTPFEVLQRESDLVDAESQKIAALQSYRAADARLERAQGTILESYRIQIDDVRQPVMR
jgi:outer membrane protein TolC